MQTYTFTKLDVYIHLLLFYWISNLMILKSPVHMFARAHTHTHTHTHLGNMTVMSTVIMTNIFDHKCVTARDKLYEHYK